MPPLPEKVVQYYNDGCFGYIVCLDVVRVLVCVLVCRSVSHGRMDLLSWISSMSNWWKRGSPHLRCCFGTNLFVFVRLVDLYAAMWVFDNRVFA